MSLLAIRAVSFAFDRRHPVLEDVSLSVARGEVVGVVGPNGAGKTTLLRIASGLLRPSAGTVSLDGTDVHAGTRREIARRIAGVAAEEAVRFPYTVRETVALGLHPWRGAFGGVTDEGRARIDEAIVDADLTAIEDRPLPALSSGERQRAALARCLVQGGDVVLLDEPTSHLDLGHRVRLLEVVRTRARAQGQGVLAALHDLNLAAAFADRLVLMVEGKVAADGPPIEVLTAERVSEAFGASVRIVPHPTSGDPVVVPDVHGGRAS